MDSRSGLVVGRRLTSATGKSAREVAQQMIGRRVGANDSHWASTRAMTPRTS